MLVHDSNSLERVRDRDDSPPNSEIGDKEQCICIGELLLICKRSTEYVDY